MQTSLQLDIWLQSSEGFVNAKINIKQRNLNSFCQYLKNSFFDIRLIPVDHVTYKIMASMEDFNCIDQSPIDIG